KVLCAINQQNESHDAKVRDRKQGDPPARTGRQQTRKRSCGQRLLQEIDIDGNGENQRVQDLQEGRSERAGEGSGHRDPVRRQKPQNSQQEIPVANFTGDFLRVEAGAPSLAERLADCRCAHITSSSSSSTCKRARRAYRPPLSRSFACVPCSTTRPCRRR